MEPVEKVSDQIERWVEADGPRTLGSLVELFEEKSFAVIFVLLLGVPALPLPTGGVTHVFEVIAMLLALQLIVGRSQVWLPQRWRRLRLDGPKQQRFVRAETHPSLDDAVQFAVTKGKQIVDQQGDRMFE